MNTFPTFPVHPAAAVFPMMLDDELVELAHDIRTNGQKVPIVIHEGTLLDGRNRLEACRTAGVEPWIQEWNGAGGSPVGFIASLNLNRRHLTKEQRAIFVVDLKPMFAKEQEAAEARRRANLKKGTSRERSDGAIGEPVGKLAGQLAAVAQVSTRLVERAERVLRDAPPDVVEKVREGKTGLSQAEKVITRREQTRKAKAYMPPEGRYSVIAADPPWNFEKRSGDPTSRGHVDYPTMSLDEICALSVGAMMAADDCVLFMWCTNAHLADGSVAEVLRAWGFTPKTVHTWIKVTNDGAAQIDAGGEPQTEHARLGAGDWGRGGTEHVVVATRGAPVCDFSSMANWFAAPRTEHSRKPPAFYERVEKACPSPAKLELFARERRSGWVCDGIEVDKFEDKPAKPPAAPKRHKAQLECKPCQGTGRKPNRKACEACGGKGYR